MRLIRCRRRVRLLAVCLSAGVLGSQPGTARAEFDPAKMDLYVDVVLTEAASESLRGQIAVAEVLRNRDWETHGFCGLRRPHLRRFLRMEAAQRAAARHAVRIALGGSNLSRGATHYENVRRFGRPKWASAMAVTTRIGRHTFYADLPGRRLNERRG